MQSMLSVMLDNMLDGESWEFASDHWIDKSREDPPWWKCTKSPVGLRWTWAQFWTVNKHQVHKMLMCSRYARLSVWTKIDMFSLPRTVTGRR
jgi:hypothetical protein